MTEINPLIQVVLNRRNGKASHNTDPSELYKLPLQRKAFIYPRLSSHEQLQRSVWSIKTQFALYELAKQDGYQTSLPQEEVERRLLELEHWFVSRKGTDKPNCPQCWEDGAIIFDARDMGLSGTLDERRREALGHFMRCCELGEIEAIYSVHPGRVWRDESGIRSLTFIDLLKRHQIRFRTPYTIFNPLDKMHEKFLRREFEYSADELDLMVRQRLGGARRTKAGYGLYAGGPIPLGFILDSQKVLDNGALNPRYQKLVPYQPHAKIVGEVFAKFVDFSGSSFATFRYFKSAGQTIPDFDPTAKEIMASEKQRSALRQCQRLPDGTYQLTSKMIRYMVQNPTYIGWLIYGKQVLSTNDHDALASEDLFWEAFHLASSRTWKPRGKAASRSPRLLAGLVYCANHSDGVRPIYSHGHSYLCETGYNSGTDRERCLSVEYHILEYPFTQHVMSRLDFSGYAERVLQQLEADYRDGKAKARNTSLALKRYTDQIENLKYAIKETASPAVRQELMTELEEVIKAREMALAQLHTSEERETGLTPRQISQVRAFLADLRNGWEKLSPEFQRRFIQLLICRVILYPEMRNLRVGVEWKDGMGTEFTVRRPWGEWRRWTDADDQLLREHYPASPRQAIMELFPDRTWKGIGQRARALGIQRTSSPERGGAFTPWSKEEDGLVKEFYAGHLSIDELCQRTERTVQAIWRRGHILGLKRPKQGRVPVIWQDSTNTLEMSEGEYCHPETALQEKWQALEGDLPGRS
jgi:hypothetical protein